MLLSNLWDLEPAGTAIVSDFIARSELVTCKVIVAAYDVVKKVQLDGMYVSTRKFTIWMNAQIMKCATKRK